jgi:hypothetical protein
VALADELKEPESVFDPEADALAVADADIEALKIIVADFVEEAEAEADISAFLINLAIAAADAEAEAAN